VVERESAPGDGEEGRGGVEEAAAEPPVSGDGAATAADCGGVALFVGVGCTGAVGRSLSVFEFVLPPVPKWLLTGPRRGADGNLHVHTSGTAFTI
jgi:hypothetical protein